jgi:hypothetical protein
LKVGDLIQMHTSKRRNGDLAGKIAHVFKTHAGAVTVFVDGKTKTLHETQIERNITNESR